ncbi:MAG TPA: Fe-S cluster assembly protein SufD [Myxococcota bacterium]|nr:Fe-S cluster assembly protein SufD [Myxococcota bacterium]
MSALDPANARLLALCERAAQRTDALAPLRRAGRDAFAASGLPDTRREEWRYTSLAPLAALDWASTGSPAPRIGARAGAEIFSTREAEAPPALGELIDLKQHPLAALATALLDDAIVVRAPDGVAIDAPIELTFLSAPAARAEITLPRLHVEAERNSSLRLVVDHASAQPHGAHFTNAITEVVVGENASVELTIVQRENDETIHASTTAVRLARDARFTSRVVTLGGRLTRNDLAVLLAGEGAECTLDGLYLGSGERLVDNHSLVDHAVPHGASRQLYKGVLGGSSRGVFRGRVIVRPGAQKTDAAQSNPNLLLSDGAEIDTKPQLEIWADDVKCSHGSAIGRLDQNALFYLRSRALGERDARALLTQGFAAEILARLPSEALREQLSAEFTRRVAAEARS